MKSNIANKFLLVFISLFLVATVVTTFVSTNASNNYNDVQQETEVKAQLIEKYGAAVFLGGMVNRLRYQDFKRLTEVSELIVIGTFLDNERQEPKFQDVSGLGEMLADVNSYNDFKIERVLKGNAPETVNIVDGYGYVEKEKQFVSFSELTPMAAGTKWIYFLIPSSNGVSYYPAGNADGRYPLPDDFDLDDILGVYDDYEAQLNAAPLAKSSDILQKSNVFRAPDGQTHEIKPQEVEGIYDYQKDFDEKRDTFTEEQLGIYDKQNFDFPLYLQIIREFDL